MGAASLAGGGGPQVVPPQEVLEVTWASVGGFAAAGGTSHRRIGSFYCGTWGNTG